MTARTIPSLPLNVLRKRWGLMGDGQLSLFLPMSAFAAFAFALDMKLLMPCTGEIFIVSIPFVPISKFALLRLCLIIIRLIRLPTSVISLFRFGFSYLPIYGHSAVYTRNIQLHPCAYAVAFHTSRQCPSWTLCPFLLHAHRSVELIGAFGRHR